MEKITNKLVEAKFLIRTLGEQIYSDMTKPKDVREVRKKVSSLLKEVEIVVNKEL